jgi:hypothetical protein
MLIARTSLGFASRWFAFALGVWLVGCGGETDGEQGVSAAADDDQMGSSDDDGGDDDDQAADDDGADDDEMAEDDDGGDDEAAPEVVAIDAQTADEVVDMRIDATFGGLADTVQSIEESDGMSSGMPDMMSDLAECGVVDPLEFDVAPMVADLDEALRDLGDTLKDEVFREDLIESDDGTTVVYYMDPALVCEAEDLECQQDLAETAVRFAVSNLSDGSMRIVAQIGENRDEPGTMILADDRVVVSADLAEALDVMRSIASDEDAQDLPETLSGVIEASIVKNANQNFSLNVGIIETVSFAQTVGDAGKQILASIAASPEAISAVVDGVANSLALSYDLSAVDVSIPGTELCGEEGEASECGAKERNGTFHVHLDGLSAGTTLEDQTSELVISNIGLGDATSYARLNNDPLVEVDVNPMDGRRFALSIQDTPDGALITIEPKLDLAVATTLVNLSEAMRMDLPDWLDDEIFSVTLGGNANGQILVPDGCAESGYALEVTKGTLTLDATSAAAPVVVETGMCLSEVESESDHPFDSVAVVACE